MKKNGFLFLLLLLIAGTSAQAQLKFGVKAGVNLSSVSLSGDGSDNIDVKNLTGFQAGPSLELMIPIINFGIDAALLYSQQGFKIKDITEDFKTHNLEIPVNLKYKISALDIIGVYLAAGPYANFKLSDDLFGQAKSKTFGAGLNFGLGVELLGHLQAGASYKLGLTDDYSEISVPGAVHQVLKGTQKGWTVSAAYFF
ncbi:MAG: PorT family protein [Dysgonamonadaceae bacterium]|nr:PorT family protein [Dysgonamonadaceae bacterium]